MKVKVLDKGGKETGNEIELIDSIFNIEPNDHAIYLDAKQYLANQRQGTSKSKERSEITGSTRKIKKQKGTGTARAGSIKSPVFRGGGRIFGPKPRIYWFKLNKKVKTLARKSALSYKSKSQNLAVVDALTFKEVKTKNYIKFLEGLKIDSKKSLIVIPELDKNIYLSGRNVPNSIVKTADQVSTYDVLNADNVVLLEGAVKKLEEILA